MEALRIPPFRSPRHARRMHPRPPHRRIPVGGPKGSAPAGTAPHRRRHVLVLDDDTAILEITALFLAHSGYLVDTAGDGEQGWEALQSGNYDLLVTDHEMPRLTGLQLVKRLRGAGLVLPVILASGSSELREAWDDRHLALTAVLLKPFPFSDLIAIARRALPPEPEPGEDAVRGRDSKAEDPTQPPAPPRPHAEPAPVTPPPEPRISDPNLNQTNR